MNVATALWLGAAHFLSPRTGAQPGTALALAETAGGTATTAAAAATAATAAATTTAATTAAAAATAATAAATTTAVTTAAAGDPGDTAATAAAESPEGMAAAESPEAMAERLLDADAIVNASIHDGMAPALHEILANASANVTVMLPNATALAVNASANASASLRELNATAEYADAFMPNIANGTAALAHYAGETVNLTILHNIAPYAMERVQEAVASVRSAKQFAAQVAHQASSARQEAQDALAAAKAASDEATTVQAIADSALHATEVNRAHLETVTRGVDAASGATIGAQHQAASVSQLALARFRAGKPRVRRAAR